MTEVIPEDWKLKEDLEEGLLVWGTASAKAPRRVCTRFLGTGKWPVWAEQEEGRGVGRVVSTGGPWRPP